ncbi:MAG: class I SAM-dependent RNA methyltransferase [Marmoricola sp.]
MVEVRTGAIAHGGHVVARHEGRVIFVRHALPEEAVRVEITEDSGRFLRGDAVEVLEASPHRVVAPCPLAHPDGCGGCDFQHVTLDEQRRLKAAVVREQLNRLAKIDWDVVCEAVPGDEQGLRWRTRMQYVDVDGRRGLRKHRSHEVVVVEDCLLAHPAARTGESGVVVESVEGGGITHHFAVEADGFWQVHPGAPSALVGAVLDQLRPAEGESALDLYAGVGLFARFVADEVGERGSVVAVESDGAAAAHAKDNLKRTATVVRDRVDRWLRRSAPDQIDLVVLDPPRVGAKAAVVAAIAAMAPRAVSYVACDPAALARDTGYFAEHGYRLRQLRCLDLFPMTHHVECVALFEPDDVS